MDLQLAEARLGIQCSEFKASDVGRYILGRLDMDVEALRDRLEDYLSVEEETQIRNELRARRLLRQYLNDAIQNGLSAEAQIEQDESEINDG